ncbi:amino acid adenylation domain-containing protein [Paenibacillus sp. 19GGS1-52]|uniref:non-ribosomal peptide synthetase/MFS transporter n=1 Tax=Paenibacillus sp. 19GGS1-52 TaxID=2758563 RepID=UPI001EFBD74D|nr:non-ribosomal peptide synthetase/MFS transporter [Paenibacillus sp. 19GGS1-52]ULO04702.1 amino acid adenylation domain-containing protein [Paenibacillus sp. 19GGS1-52]
MSHLSERINQLTPQKRELLMARLKDKTARKTPEPEWVASPRSEFDNTFPLSYSQQRLWFLYQWAPDSPTYNIPCVFHLPMAVDAILLEQAIQQLVERHEILRTTYKTYGEESLQVVHPFTTLKLEVVNLEDLPQTQRTDQMEALILEKSLEPFKLEDEIPLKAYLYTLDENRHCLLLNIHHIACDGWSIGIIMDEIQQAYTALLHHQPLELEPIRYQYADFASWQRNYLTGDVLSYHQSYWKDKLQGDLPVLELATDKPRLPERSFNGAVIIQNFPNGLYARLQQFCKEEDVTPYMAMLAAYFIFLYRYTGQKDLIVGSAAANRSRSEIERSIGFFVNTLPLRLQIDEGATFRETVQQVKQLSLDALEHQDLPLDKIMELVTIERDLSHSPLFQTLFVLQNMHVGGGDNQDFQLHFNGSRNTSSSKFDLTFSATEESVQAEYSSDLFHESTVIGMLEHYSNLLERASTAPDQLIAHINLLTEAESNVILEDWSGVKNSTEHEGGFHLVQCIEAQAAMFPNHIALVNEDIFYTYEEMNTRANRIAHHLREQGVGPETTVGIVMERSAEVVIALLAVLKAGGAYVPLDPSYPRDRLQFMIRESRMTTLITQRKLSVDLQLEELAEIALLHVDQDELWLTHANTENLVTTTESHNLMYMIFTSGTTGRPKGVSVELRQFHNYIQGMLLHLQITEPFSYCLASTFAADLGTTNIFGALCTGGTLHVLSYDRSCDPDGVAQYFQKNRIDIMKIVPSHCEALLEAEHPEFIIPHKILILAGEGLSWETVSRIQSLQPSCRIENHYGPTETTVSALAFTIIGDADTSSISLVPIGRPIANVQAYILDPNLNLLPAGVPGELYIGGNGVSRGYNNNLELNSERFIRSPFGERGERLYKTGDRARFQQDGSIEITGRMDRQIKIRGYRIELGEIEAVLTSIPFVKSAVVLLKSLTQKEKRIVAYTVLDKLVPVEESLAELKQRLKQILPDYMMPNHIIVLDALPLNPNGKVNLPLLTAMDLTLNTADATDEGPRTVTEQRIEDVWRAVLGDGPISIDDNFFELGGESFKALKVVRRLEDWIGIMDFFKHPTIRTLAEYIDQGKPSEHHLLHRLTKSGPQHNGRVTLVCIPYAGGSAITYQPLAMHMPSTVDLYAMDIPGHDYSRKEEALLPIHEVARLCIQEIKSSIKGPVALYGHCVGGALTIEIARQLEQENMPLRGVFLGGTFPIARIPGRLFNWFSKLFPSDRSMSNKSYHEFLKALGGFTDVEDNEERDFMIRCLRHDARESENYYTFAYSDKEFTKLSTPINCIIGQKDKATELYEERFREWGYFSNQVELAVIPLSGHYFIKYQADQLNEIITATLGLVSPQKDKDDALITDIGDIQVSTSPHPPAVIARKQRGVSPNLKIFFTVIFGQLMSILGSGLTGIAIGVWVYSQTQSVADFAAISSASLIPGILVLPFAGAIVDRYDRRLVMLFSDLMMALPIAWLAVLMATHSLEVWHIYVSSAIGSVSRSFHRPAFMASIAQIIPKQYLGHANGIVQLAGSTSEMIAPLLGVALYSTIGMANIFILDVVSFFIAITTLLIVRFPNTLFSRQEESFLKEVLMGWKFIVKRPGLLYMIAFFFIGNILFGAASVLIQPLVLSFGTPADLAAVTMLGALGAVAGGLVMSLWGGTQKRAAGMVGFVILEGFFMIVTGLRANILMTAVGLFGLWFSVTLVNAHWQSLIQSKVGLQLQGRVLATNQMIAMSSMPIGYWLSGLLADSVFNKAMEKGGFLTPYLGPVLGVGTGRGIGLLMASVGALVLIWSVVGFRFKPLRNMEDDLEDAIPDATLEDRDSLQTKLDQRIVQLHKANKSVEV